MTDKRTIKPETDFEVPVFNPKPVISPKIVEPIDKTLGGLGDQLAEFEDSIVADEKQVRPTTTA